MTTQEQTANILANKVIHNPELLRELNDNTFLKFVLCVAKYSKPLARKVMDLRPNIPSQHKVILWEAIGILVSLNGDIANEFNNNYLADEYEDFDPYDGL